MSIPEYLNSLDHSQLLKAREIADELIAKKEAEKKIKLLVVSVGRICHAYYRESEIEQAKAKAIELINEDNWGEVRKGCFDLEIGRINVFESEVDEYLNHWKN